MLTNGSHRQPVRETLGRRREFWKDRRTGWESRSRTQSNLWDVRQGKILMAFRACDESIVQTQKLKRLTIQTRFSPSFHLRLLAFLNGEEGEYKGR